MFKFLGRRFGRGGVGPSSSSAADSSDKFLLEKGCGNERAYRFNTITLKYCTHGFPLAPSCMTFDVHRRVLHIGTAAGEIRVIGQPGVELTGLHDDINKVLQILPFASESSLITVCSNNLMHKWSMVDSEGNARLVLRRTYKFQGGLAKTITTCCLPPRCDCLFVGTLGGITYPMDTEFDGMSPEVLSWSRARAYASARIKHEICLRSGKKVIVGGETRHCSLKYDGKDVPGEVRTLDINPANPIELLIGYERNYLELWDALSWKPITYFGAYKSEEIGNLLATSWHSGGAQFVTTHGDGSFLFWNTTDPLKPFKKMKPYGSEYVQDMNIVLWPDEDLLVVSGGSPQTVVDGHCISVMEGEEVHTFQVTSAVKGMHVLDGIHLDKDSGIVNYGEKEGEGSVMNNRVLILLLEQEILFIELSLPEFPLLQPPYLYSVHNSPVRCMQVYEDIPKDVWLTIYQAGRVQLGTVYTGRSKNWPIDGGLLGDTGKDTRNLLVTGHEDGTIKFWDIGTISMRLLYVLKTSMFFSSLDSDLFKGESPENEHNVKQMSFWDPRSDDDQVQISCIRFYGDQLVVGFVGGSALLFGLNKQSSTVVIPLHRVSILREDPRQRGRNWQAPMEVRLDGMECAPGYQPTLCIAIYPNVPVSVVALAKEQKLVGIGSMYGFAIIDTLKLSTLHVGSTYQETEEETGHLSRMQSIRKSFRQSLKRLNVRRSMRGGQSVQRSYRPALVRSGSTRPSMKNRSNTGGQGAGISSIGASPRSLPEAAAPAPPRRDSVKTITFSAPNHLAGHALVCSVVVGTNQGGVMAYSIDVPSSKHRNSKSPILMPIEKEYNAKKNHSVVFCGILDHQHYLLDINDSGSYHQNSSKGSQWIVIITEDAIKVLGLPSMKKKFRLRLKQSDNDEYHVQSGHFIRIRGQSFLGIMGSDGFVCVYTLPELKLVCKEDCVDAADAVGQRNFSLTQHGLIVHMRSPSEFTRAAINDESKMEFHFSIPCKSMDKFVLGPSTPKSLSREPAIELLQDSASRHHEVSLEPSEDEPAELLTLDATILDTGLSDEGNESNVQEAERTTLPVENSDIQASHEENGTHEVSGMVEDEQETLDVPLGSDASAAIPDPEPNNFQERAL